MNKFACPIFAFLIAFLFAFNLQLSASNFEVYQDFKFNGQKRQYLIHTPANWDRQAPIPLLIALHGGGGNARQFCHYSGFDSLSDHYNFAVIYPNALHKHWNDERGDLHLTNKLENADDIGFLTALIDSFVTQTPIGKFQVVLTGISNGGIMSIRLALEHPDKYSGIAPIASSMSQSLYEKVSGKPPVSLPEMLIINGTSDPLVPYNGGDIMVLGKARGKVIGTKSTLDFWAKNNSNDLTPCQKIAIPDLDSYDYCTASQFFYCPTSTNKRLSLIQIINGGHTMPGKRQYLPRSLVGNTCYDFNAAQSIVQFYFVKIQK